jgi:uncharacterized LabA/DUF88 family protein
MSEKTLLAIYIDFQNVKLTASQAESLISFANQFGYLSNQKVYADWQIESKSSPVYFHELGFECLNIPSNKKNNVDNKLIADCEREQAPIIFLVTGDGDFTKLVNSLKSKGKKITIFYQPGNVNLSLIQSANAAYTVKKLPELVGNHSSNPLQRCYSVPAKTN